MRIQHNIMAMNAYRNYNNNTSALSSNLEKLSSGYKINRAGDDAAGLAISEKMRAQITGLDAAQKNVKDGISLVKTAEGAMQEIQDMLNRMDYLATQSANGTYDNEVDRANLQKEVDALKTEINRIADSANFNGIKLLDGSQTIKDAVDGTPATSETIIEDISGMDRIITSVLGKDETASIEAGKKTILDDVVKGSAKAASLTIDLKTLNLKATGSLSATALASTTITLTVGGVDIKVKGSAVLAKAGGKITATTDSKVIAKALASAVVQAIASKGTVYKAGTTTSALGASKATGVSAGSKTVTINGVDWKASVTADGVLKFTQVKVPETEDQARANFDVNIKIETSQSTGNSSSSSDDFLTIQIGNSGTSSTTSTNSAGTQAKLTLSASLNAGTAVATAGVPTQSTNKANTVFNITADDIKDGTKIAIGTKSIILKVGSDSTVKASTNAAKGQYVVELGKNDNLNTALNKISQAVGSTVNLSIATKNGGSAKVEFKLGVSGGENGNVVGLTIQRQSNATSIETAFSSLEQLAANFKMQVTTTNEIAATEGKAAQKGLTLQIGDTSDKFNQLSVSIGDMHTSAMGTGKATLDGEEIEVTKTIADIDISSQEGAAEAVQVIRNAINYVSSVRGDLGATQNRLEHTANNLSVMAENIQDAESTIRDTDVAEEMMSYVKNNILVQSAQAMLAQANQVPQGVLQLLG